MNRVVITGWGLVTSLSCEVEDCWQRILAGESGVHQIKLFDCSDIKVKMGADVWDWDCTDIVGKRLSTRSLTRRKTQPSNPSTAASLVLVSAV